MTRKIIRNPLTLEELAEFCKTDDVVLSPAQWRFVCQGLDIIDKFFYRMHKKDNYYGVHGFTKEESNLSEDDWQDLINKVQFGKQKVKDNNIQSNIHPTENGGPGEA